MATRSPDINVMITAVTRAARALLRDYGEVDALQSSPKGIDRFVSQSLRRTQSTLVRELTRARADYPVDLTEDAAVAPKDRSPRWLVEPIAGFDNFCHALPFFAVTVAVVMGAEPVAAVVYDPLRDEIFWAERGSGAYLNDNRLRIRQQSHVAEAVLAVDDPAMVADLSEPVTWRSFGCPALGLSYVAAGRLDGYWASTTDLRRMAAGTALLREAGGQLHMAPGNGPGSAMTMLAGGSQLHKRLAPILAKTDHRVASR